MKPSKPGPAPREGLVSRKLLLGLLLALSLMACGGDTPSGQVPSVVRIGLLYPLTGDHEAAGKDVMEGITLALEMIEGDALDPDLPLAGTKGLDGLGGAHIQILLRDVGNDPRSVRALVRELVEKEGVAALMGCYASSLTATASEQAEILRVPFLNDTSTAPHLTRRGLRWFFRTTPDDEIFSRNFFAFLRDVGNRREVEVPHRLVLLFENGPWGTGVARAERHLALDQHYILASEVPYDPRQEDFREELLLIRNAMPAILLQASYERDALLLLKGCRDMGIRPHAILGMDAGFIGPTFIRELGPFAEGILSREVWAEDVARKKPLAARISRRFRERFGREMTGNSARAFTGILTLLEAIDKAGSVAPDRIREALLQIHVTPDRTIMPWDGIAFDPDTGQNVLGKGLIVQVQEGRYVTVWPWDQAEPPLCWPFPGLGVEGGH